jgi:hypothetical protein
MRSPIRPLPNRVIRWTYVLTLLRALDAAAAWLVVLAATAWLLPGLSVSRSAAVALMGTGAAACVSALRTRWRPVTAAVCFALSGTLRAGDRAWYVRTNDAELVVVTARRRLRLVIASPGQGGAEGIIVRRTRVLLVRADRR